MGYSELSLPTDIPWKRLAVSADMIDSEFGDLRFPAKWDTSIVVFYHEPSEVDPAYCNRKITYLKIVCTITNYQLKGPDITAFEKLRTKFEGWKSWKEFELNTTRSYPCHGALLQVGVYPNPSKGVEVYDFPYISSLQPRKRELYEVATQSGEVASQSANKLNVMKGGTTTGTTEDYDLDMGGGSGGHSGIFGLWSEQHSGEQKQVGTIQRKQTQDQNISTSDASRDRREAYSFSTSINQLHTLLQSYHLGTNRAMFFLQPVPHMQDAKFSFVPGLRRIEGIQEFFLIINRPARVQGFCLEIVLETAHLYVKKKYMPRLIPISDLYTPINLAKTEESLGSILKNSPLFDYYRSLRDAWNSLWAHERLAINKESWQTSDPENEALAHDVFTKVPGIGTQDVALIFEEYDALTGKFFVIGRRFEACWLPKTGNDHGEDEEACEESSESSLAGPKIQKIGSIVYEAAYSSVLWSQQNQKAFYSNSITAGINQELFSSLLSPNRREYGTGSFFSTEFMLEELNELVKNAGDALPMDRIISDFRVTQDLTVQNNTCECLTLREFTQLSTETTARRFNLSIKDAPKFRMEVLLEALDNVDIGSLVAAEEVNLDESMHERNLRFAAVARGNAQPQSGHVLRGKE